ncbi:hypothetical protein Tco_1123181 [Tanacetum coccineum]|uniref:Uncharacterized protein n=1 Tax=Tanacetum coccineum TaxID=301880 RepID=A0ABQ5J365_9ASTR
MDQNEGKKSLEPHVLIFPIPFQGPVNCALKLAELLCLSGMYVTFLNTDHIHRPLLRYTDVLSRFSHYPNFRFETIPDGLVHENPVSGDRFEEVMEAVNGVETSTPVVSFETISPSCLWTSCFNLRALIESGHVPLKG